MSGWSEENVLLLKKLWGSGISAREIAEKMGPGFTRNSIIGKASRLNLSAKIKTRSAINYNAGKLKSSDNKIQRKTRRSKFRSLILDKNFEPAKNLSLEELTEETCKYMEGHPDQEGSSFCGRKNVEKFSYCPLHLMIVFQPKGKKEDVIEKEDDVPQFIEKKIKSA